MWLWTAIQSNPDFSFISVITILVVVLKLFGSVGVFVLLTRELRSHRAARGRGRRRHRQFRSSVVESGSQWATVPKLPGRHLLFGLVCSCFSGAASADAVINLSDISFMVKRIEQLVSHEKPDQGGPPGGTLRWEFCAAAHCAPMPLVVKIQRL